MDLLAALPVSLRQLQYIVAVAEHGSFRRAADACHVAQPSLSAQVGVAERALGVQLFERTGRRVRVPPPAAPLIAQARRILVAAGDLRELARQRADPFRGTLRLGVIPTICPYLLPDVAPSLARDYPDLTIDWREERTAHLAQQMKQGAIDAALVAVEADLSGLEHAPLGWDPFFLATAPGHPLARASKPVTPGVLDGARVFLLDDGHCFREQALQLCTRAGARETGLRATSLATLVQMVSASGGVTLLPSIALPVENRRGQLMLRPFADPGPGRTLALVWRRGSALRAPLVRIADTLRAALANRLAPSGPRPPRRRP
ncbi:MAG TPA: LysR substrate-binding domain-containing protein [Vicinamibacterales bacterium]|nr:LysR substrate-binding domain-containing protein [Vicinamibacterales bacterium]